MSQGHSYHVTVVTDVKGSACESSPTALCVSVCLRVVGMQARRYYQETKDAKGACQKMPKYMSIEVRR